MCIYVYIYIHICTYIYPIWFRIWNIVSVGKWFSRKSSLRSMKPDRLILSLPRKSLREGLAAGIDGLRPSGNQPWQRKNLYKWRFLAGNIFINGGCPILFDSWRNDRCFFEVFWLPVLKEMYLIKSSPIRVSYWVYQFTTSIFVWMGCLWQKTTLCEKIVAKHTTNVCFLTCLVGLVHLTGEHIPF